MVAERREIVTVLTVDARDLEAKAAATAASIDKIGDSLIKLSTAPKAVETKQRHPGATPCRAPLGYPGTMAFC